MSLLTSPPNLRAQHATSHRHGASQLFGHPQLNSSWLPTHQGSGEKGRGAEFKGGRFPKEVCRPEGQWGSSATGRGMTGSGATTNRHSTHTPPYQEQHPPQGQVTCEVKGKAPAQESRGRLIPPALTLASPSLEPALVTGSPAHTLPAFWADWSCEASDGARCWGRWRGESSLKSQTFTLIKSYSYNTMVLNFYFAWWYTVWMTSVQSKVVFIIFALQSGVSAAAGQSPHWQITFVKRSRAGSADAIYYKVALRRPFPDFSQQRGSRTKSTLENQRALKAPSYIKIKLVSY